MAKVYSGEISCQGTYKSGKKKGTSCQNGAYYDVKGIYLCGVHAKGEARKELPKNPQCKKLQEQKNNDHEKTCIITAEINRKEGKSGLVAVAKMGMRKAIPHRQGDLSIFPNFKHGNRKDGYGLPSLSPMSLGPINHGYPHLSPAFNLENFYQGAKIYPGEVDKDNKITPEAHHVRDKLYQDETPYRHKFKVPYFTGDTKVKTPLYSLHYRNGKEEEVRYSYLESRYLYCYWYEKLVKEQENFLLLKGLIKAGYNLLIIGYDGYDVEGKDLYACYLDTTKPFGHELVLYTLLTIQDEKDYPWQRYYTQNKDLYEGVVPLEP
jgi:hypothetical protein